MRGPILSSFELTATNDVMMCECVRVRVSKYCLPLASESVTVFVCQVASVYEYCRFEVVCEVRELCLDRCSSGIACGEAHWYSPVWSEMAAAVCQQYTRNRLYSGLYSGLDTLPSRSSTTRGSGSETELQA